TGVEQRPRVVDAADPTRGLHRRTEPGHRADELWANAAAARAVEVDEVDAAGAEVGAPTRARDNGGGAVDAGLIVAPLEADRVRAEHVDSRYHLDRLREPHAHMLAC